MYAPSPGNLGEAMSDWTTDATDAIDNAVALVRDRTVEPAKAGAIKVFATNRKQGKKLDDAFALAGVTFVPLP